VKYLRPTFILLSVLVIRQAWSQQVPACAGPEYTQLDFWVGDWDLTWKDSAGTEVKGMNSITKDLDGCVIHERFNSISDGYLGESVSVYDAEHKQWKQTWVDSKGSYMLFTGGLNNGMMDLRMERPAGNGTTELSSMIWQNVTPTSMDWVWRKSVDGGKQWQTLWKIHYTKRASVQNIPMTPGAAPVILEPSSKQSPSPPPTTLQSPGQQPPGQNVPPPNKGK